ncbi:uncharacterized protein LOC141854676 [Brevipalpus obovatus]|uniref:uncharacterized protein LOC141854676 n=1 Tax=Brevipalpus obovatus TaxID=246614 RepID=UPI003D9F80C6
MSLHCWLLLIILGLLALYEVDAECITAKLPLREGEIRPIPFIVHVWVSRFDTGEHSCIGIVKKGNRILVPKWCVNVEDQPRGRIAIYAPKSPGKVTSFTRSCPYQRYDEQFDLVYQDDDLRELIEPSDGSLGTNLPYVVVLKIPKSISHLTVACFWSNGDMFDSPSTTVAVSYRYGPNGEFFLVQKIISDSIKRKETYEALREGIEDVAEALISVSREKLPHRLTDNLRWRCTICNVLVSTSDTHNHLMTCVLDTALNIESDRRKRSMQSNINNSNHNNRPQDRPRTKRLERPTPNLRHPVIESLMRNDFFSANQLPGDTSDTSAKIQSKSIFPTSRTSKRIGGHRGVDSIGFRFQTQSNRCFKKPCNSCERSSAPERFHSHHDLNGKKCIENSSIKSRSESDSQDPQVPIKPTELCYDWTSSKMKCYLCKKDFTPEEMEDHEAGCLERWKSENSGQQRLAILHRPSLSSIPGCDPEGWEHFKSQLNPCSKCGRTFFPHRLATHEKACRGPENKLTNQPNVKAHPSGPIKNPRRPLATCSKCGKKFSYGSLRIHEFSCGKRTNS